MITEKVIIGSFIRVGQFNPSLPGPDRQQILKKAAAARLKCSGVSSWLETEDLRVTREEAQHLLDEIDKSMKDLEEKLRKAESELQRQSRQSPELDPQLIRITQKIDKLRARKATRQQQLRNTMIEDAEEEIQQLVAAPVDSDPEIVSIFRTRTWGISNLPFLRIQHGELSTRVTALEEEAPRLRDCRMGQILARGEIVGIPELLTHRKQLLKDLKTEIKRLDDTVKALELTLRSCITPSCTSKSSANSNWTRCPTCHRGFCKTCSKTMTLADHQPTCGSPSEPQQSFSELTNDLEEQQRFPELTDDLEQLIDQDSADEFIDSLSSAEYLPITRTATSPLPHSTALDSPQTLTLTPNPEGNCLGCGFTKELSDCGAGHPLCLSCIDSCSQCRKRTRTPKKLISM